MEIILALDVIKKLQETGGTTRDYMEVAPDIYLWTASLVLLNHLAQDQKGIQGKRVLELGSGLGHLAFGLSVLGAHVTATELAGRNLKELAKSVKAQMELSRKGGVVPAGSISIVPCSWGREGFVEFSSSQEQRSDDRPFEIIIMAESIYKEALYAPLLETLCLLTDGGWRGAIYASMVSS